MDPLQWPVVLGQASLLREALMNFSICRPPAAQTMATMPSLSARSAASNFGQRSTTSRLSGAANPITKLLRLVEEAVAGSGV